MKFSLRRLPGPLRIFLAALKGWDADDATRLGASVAYYSLFALAPMLVIVVAIAGFVYGADAVRGELVGQIQGLVGRSGAELIESLLKGTQRQGSGTLAIIVGVLVLIVGSIGTFIELQYSLNRIWRVKTDKYSGIRLFLIRRLRSFGMVMSIGFLLLVSLAVNAALAASARMVTSDATITPIFWNVVNQIVSLLAITTLFAMMFRMLPDVKLHWRHVRVGAMVSAGLFTLGKYLIGLYLGKAAPDSGYGAAGSVVILLIWIFFSAQVVMIGAEVTRVLVRAEGIVPRTRPGAVRTGE